MENSLKIYYDNLQKPWSKLFYEMLTYQLSFAQNMRILDFGSGFGIMANELARQNEVVAIEPNIEMVKHSVKDNYYTLYCGGIEILDSLAPHNFDLIICHNVLEYVDSRASILAEFERVLKKNGQLSIVKHNHNGRIMQKVVFENNVEEALSLLNGGESLSESFGKINYYDIEDITCYNLSFAIDKIYGVRTFWALQQNNEIKHAQIWFDNMLRIETAVQQKSEFVKIAFFNHLLLTKKR